MRRRFPLLLKKRGRRRSGSPVWASVGEALYHAMFVAAGTIGLWWTLSDVLLPEWRLAEEAEGFQRTTCVVRGQRVVPRPGLAEQEFCAEVEVEFTPEGDSPLRVWTRHGVGRDTISREEASAALTRYAIGSQRECWYDSADPKRVVLSVRRRWWPWLVLSIPLSLIAIGGIGLVRTFVSTQSSPERRSAHETSGLDFSQFEPGNPRPTIASGLPPVEKIDDSPGVEQLHRLPIDGAGGWRVAGMATLCGVWNLLVALFVYQIGVDYLSVGIRIAMAVLIAGPLAYVGWRMTLSTWQDAGASGSTTRIEVDRHPLVCGETAKATLLQYGPRRLRGLVVSLICEEIATYRQGTDSRTAVVETFRKQLAHERRLDVAVDETIRIDFEIRTPAAGPHSFVSPNNEVRWMVEVVATTQSRGELHQRFPLCVYPTALRLETMPPRVLATGART